MQNHKVFILFIVSAITALAGPLAITNAGFEDQTTFSADCGQAPHPTCGTSMWEPHTISGWTVYHPHAIRTVGTLRPDAGRLIPLGGANVAYAEHGTFYQDLGAFDPQHTYYVQVGVSQQANAGMMNDGHFTISLLAVGAGDLLNPLGGEILNSVSANGSGINDGEWSIFSFFASNGNAAGTLRIRIDTEFGSQYNFDDVIVATVPEPGTWLLGAIGLAALGLRRRFRTAP